MYNVKKVKNHQYWFSKKIWLRTFGHVGTTLLMMGWVRSWHTAHAKSASQQADSHHLHFTRVSLMPCIVSAWQLSESRVSIVLLSWKLNCLEVTCQNWLHQTRASNQRKHDNCVKESHRDDTHSAVVSWCWAQCFSHVCENGWCEDLRKSEINARPHNPPFYMVALQLCYKTTQTHE